MGEKTLRVLLLADYQADVALVTEALDRSGMSAVARRADSRDTFIGAIRDFQPDVVLSDPVLARFDARAALQVLQAVRPTAALIVVADALDDRSAAAFVRAGAEDFVLRSNLSRLAPAIEAALSVRRRLEKLTPRQMEVLRLMT